MSALQLQNLSAIIIDDHPEMCKQLHLMLERLGLRRIVSAHSGEKAIELIAKADFNLILCDFDLGRGKNGLQVLEECRHRHIIKNTSCFIMISAVQTGELVLGAIENQPDAYIIKPITFDDLRLRLERTINIKDTYYDIFHNIDKKNYSAALSACNLLLKQRPKLSLSVLKHKARLYCLMDDHIKAEKMYSEILNIRTLAWAQLGLAKTCLALNKLEQAQHLLEQLIRQHKSHIPAYDLLAEIKALRGDTVGAQGALETALQYSPCSVRRQSFLSKLAIENQDWDAAMISSRRGIDLGKYSMFCSADNYIHLTAALKPQLNSESLSKRRAASIEIFKTVEGLKKDFKSDPVVLVSAHFIEGSTHKQLGQTKESEKCILVATELIKQNNLDQRSQDLQLIGQRMSLACDADTLKDFIDSDICTNLSNDFKKNLQKVKKSTAHNEVDEPESEIDIIDKFNNKGVQFFEQGALAEAIQMFEQATTSAVASYSILLNGMQAHIAYLQKHGRDQFSYDACQKIIKRLETMPPTDRRRSRKNKLESMFNQLEKEWK